MKYLILLAVAILAAFTIFRVIDESTKGTTIDPILVGLIGMSYILIGLTMLLFTRKWSVRALGLLSVLLGGAVDQWSALVFHLQGDPAKDLVRALFVVGMAFLAVGFWNYYFRHDDDDNVTGF